MRQNAKAYADSQFEALGNSSDLDTGIIENTVLAGDDPRFAEIGKNDGALGLQIAQLMGTRQALNAGFSDSYEDKSGIMVPATEVDEYTLLLLHGNSDISGKAVLVNDGYQNPANPQPDYSLVPYADVTISNERAKFGTTSLKFPGTNSTRILGNGAIDYAMGTGIIS